MNKEELTPEKVKEMMEKIPKPEVSHIRLKDIQDISIPHPYCIGTKHVEYASDHWHRILGTEAIREAEENGAVCCICKEKNKKSGERILSYGEHISRRTLFIEVPQNKDLNKVEGLHAYLLKIKDIATEMGIDRFTFPDLKE